MKAYPEKAKINVKIKPRIKYPVDSETQERNNQMQ